MSDKDETVTETTEAPRVRKRRQMPTMGVATARTLVAQLVWIVCVIFALVLAIAVLLIAVNANLDNSLVKFDGKFADHVDLSVFDLNNPVKDFDKSSAPLDDVKTALFNYGICAIVWLAIGRIVDKIVRPSRTKTTR